MGQYRLNEPAVVAEVVDGEVIAINLENGCYHSMQGGGARVWEALTAGRSFDEILGAAEDPASARPALSAFVEQLGKLGLILPAATELAVSGEAPATGWSPTELRIETFRDMQDLLLLDPVHDVAVEAGWPVRR